jgi:hypothetical protein
LAVPQVAAQSDDGAMRHKIPYDRLVVDKKQRLRRDSGDNTERLGIIEDIVDDFPRRFLLFDRFFNDRCKIFIHRQLIDDTLFKNANLNGKSLIILYLFVFFDGFFLQKHLKCLFSGACIQH